jgi:hypothetical protein
VVLHRLQEGDVGGHEDGLEQRGADDDAGRHAQQVDHGRHHQKGAADAHDCRQHADQEAEAEGQQRADVESGATEAHLQRQAMHPGVLMELARRRTPAAQPQDRAQAFNQHEGADARQQEDVGEVDDQVDLADSFQDAEQHHAHGGAMKPPASNTDPILKSTLSLLQWRAVPRLRAYDLIGLGRHQRSPAAHA